MSSKETWDHGIAARRYLIHMGYTMLGDAAQTRNQAERERLFIQAYNYLYCYVRPDLVVYDEPREHADQITATTQLDPQLYAGITDARWAKICWWTDALFRSGIFAANPQGDEISKEDLLEDRADLKTEFFAARSYRKLTINVHKRLAKAASVSDGSWANVLWDHTFPLVYATAFPVVQRLEKIRQTVDAIWSDPVPRDEAERRALRMDTVSVLVDALHRAAVLAEPRTPVDETSRDNLLKIIQERTGQEGT